MSGYQYTAYFEKEVLRKRPSITLSRTGDCAPSGVLFNHSISSIPDRQSDDKRGPLAFLAGDIQPPAVSGDDVVGNAES
jgi:hypothetical protein